MIRLLFTNFHPFDGGGHATYFKTLIACLHGAPEFELHAGVPQTSKTYQIAISHHIPAHALDFPGKLREFSAVINNVLKLRSLLKRIPFDIIHSNGSPDHRLVIYTLWTLPKKNRPALVLTKHNAFPVKQTWLNRVRYQKYCDHVIVVCRHLKQQFVEIQTTPNECSVIPNGVDVDTFAPEPTLSSRAALGLPEDAIIFVSCAGSGSHKGWHLLANAIAQLSPTVRQKVCCCVLGSEPTLDKKKALLIEPDMPELVFPGHQEDVRPFLHNADIGFVLSTSVETISFAAREMMACGLPLLVSDYGCLADNVTPECGWVVPANSVDALLEEVPTLLKADLKHMGQSARTRAVAEFSHQQMARKMQQLYQRLYQMRKTASGI